MAGVLKPVAWVESAEELYERYRQEKDVERRTRLGALWGVRHGESASHAAQQAGVGRRTLTRWLAWYRTGGLAAVLARVPGHGAPGAAGRLAAEQVQALLEHSSQGQLRTYEDARRWVLEPYGVGYSYTGMYTLLTRLGVRPKVPRPVAVTADPDQQAAWNKGGSATH
jgi:transposase